MRQLSVATTPPVHLWCGERRKTAISTGWHKKTGTFENPNKHWRNSRKKNIDRNWTITTWLLRDSNPNYQCLKTTSCRWRPPPRMHSFTPTTHFKSSRSFVSLCVCCMLCRMRQFLSIIFFFWISSIFVGFFKSSRFFVSLCIKQITSSL